MLHSSTCNAPYIHPSHDLILELWQTFPNGKTHVVLKFLVCDLKAQPRVAMMLS